MGQLLAAIATVIFIVELFAVLREEQLNRHKAINAGGAAVILWVLVALAEVDHYHEHLDDAMLEVFEVFFFLFFAMAHVANVEDQNFFDWIRSKIYSWGWGNEGQFLAISVFSFFGSALFDNLTTTLVAVAIARRFFSGKNMAITTIAIIFNANAGGAWSPIGDIPTIQFWLAEKFTATEVVIGAFIPSFLHFLIVTAYGYFQIEKGDEDIVPEAFEFTRGNQILTGISIVSFLLPILARQIGEGLPPFMGLFFGMFVVWHVRHFLNENGQSEEHNLGAPEDVLGKENGGAQPHDTALTREIYGTLRATDWATLVFFVGILFSVSALSAFGVLKEAAVVLETAWDTIPGIDVETGESWIYLNNDLVGALSMVVDNVPVAALSLDTFTYPHWYHWAHLAYTLGTGGSLLPIGSAAGVVALGLVPSIKRYYLKYVLFAGVWAYLVGAVVGQLMAPLFT